MEGTSKVIKVFLWHYGNNAVDVTIQRRGGGRGFGERAYLNISQGSVIRIKQSLPNPSYGDNNMMVWNIK